MSAWVLVAAGLFAAAFRADLCGAESSTPPHAIWPSPRQLKVGHSQGGAAEHPGHPQWDGVVSPAVRLVLPPGTAASVRQFIKNAWGRLLDEALVGAAAGRRWWRGSGGGGGGGGGATAAGARLP